MTRSVSSSRECAHTETEEGKESVARLRNLNCLSPSSVEPAKLLGKTEEALSVKTQLAMMSVKADLGQ